MFTAVLVVKDKVVVLGQCHLQHSARCYQSSVWSWCWNCGG